MEDQVRKLIQKSIKRKRDSIPHTHTYSIGTLFSTQVVKSSMEFLFRISLKLSMKEKDPSNKRQSPHCTWVLLEK